jgi:hypothetical protein
LAMLVTFALCLKLCLTQSLNPPLMSEMEAPGPARSAQLWDAVVPYKGTSRLVFGVGKAGGAQIHPLGVHRLGTRARARHTAVGAAVARYEPMAHRRSKRSA